MTPAEALAALDRWAAILQVPDLREAAAVLRAEWQRTPGTVVVQRYDGNPYAPEDGGR